MAPTPRSRPSLKQIGFRWNRARTCWLWAATLAFLSAAAAKGAETQLQPSSDQLGYTAYVFGLLPVPASFAAFSGTLRVDAARPASCAVHVTVDVSSLRMADPARRAQALGPAMLDAARYPRMIFNGACQGSLRLAGQLTLHGVTRAFTLSLRRQGGRVEASGLIRRRDYGILGLPYLVGQRIRVRLSVALPAGLAG